VFEERLNKMDTTDSEVSREKSDAVAENQEVPNEEAEVEPVGALKGRHEDLHLAVGRRRETKKRTQGNGGSRKKFPAPQKKSD
jgi:hypothetical protein